MIRGTQQTGYGTVMPPETAQNTHNAFILDATPAMAMHIRNNLKRLEDLNPDIFKGYKDVEFGSSESLANANEVVQEYYVSRMSGPGFYIFNIITGGIDKLPLPTDYQTANAFINKHFSMSTDATGGGYASSGMSSSMPLIIAAVAAFFLLK